MSYRLRDILNILTIAPADLKSISYFRQMKKLFLFILLITLCFKAHSQSISMSDLFHLYQYRDPQTFLTAKGFKLAVQDKELTAYGLKVGTAKEENVWFYLKIPRIVYHLYDRAFVNKQLKFVAKNYKLLLKKEGKADTFYRFGNDNIKIEIDVVNDLTQVCDIKVFGVVKKVVNF